MKLLKTEQLFFGCKIDSKMREALALAKPGDRKYFEDPKSEFLRVLAVEDERWIGKLINGGTQVTEVDDIQRNIISILKRISPTLRITTSSLKIFATAAGDSAPALIDDVPGDDDELVDGKSDGPYIIE